MARGHQKIRSQQKNQQKKASEKKKGFCFFIVLVCFFTSTLCSFQIGQGSKDTASAAYIYTCSVCKGNMTGIKVYKEHFEAKHPKAETPPELVEYNLSGVEA
jgi:hypothetical protein